MKVRSLVAGFITAAVILGVLFLGARAVRGGPTHEMSVDFPSASGLVPGSDVFEAGAKVGTITDIRPTETSHAIVTVAIDDDHWPLHSKGLSIDIRPKSLLGEKYVDVHDGDPGSGPYQPDTARPYQASATSVPVELDQFINSLDDQTRTSAKVLLSDLGAGLAGRGLDLNDAIRTGRDNLAHLAVTGQTLANRDPELDRILVSLDGVLAKLTTDDQLTQFSSLIHTGKQVLDAVEAERAAFSKQFVDAQAALTDLNQAIDPAVNSLRDTLATAPQLFTVLKQEADQLATLGGIFNQSPFPKLTQQGLLHGPTASGGAVENINPRSPIFRVCNITDPQGSGTPNSPQQNTSCTGNGFHGAFYTPAPAQTASDSGGDGYSGTGALPTLLGFLGT